MNLKLIFLALFVVLTTQVSTGQSGAAHALIGVDVFNGHAGDLTNMTIVVQNDKIVDIFKTDSKPLADSIHKLTLTGYYVLPGLIDTHVHMGMRQLTQSPEASRKEFRKWIFSGVTSVRDMGGDARALAIENKRIKENQQPGPDIYFSATVGSTDMLAKDMRLKNVTRGIGVENASFVIEAKPGMNVLKSISGALESGVTGLKFYAGIRAELIAELTKEAHKNGLKSWAHFTVFPDRPLEVVKAGVDVVSHVWGVFWQDPDVDPSEKIPFTHTDFEGARAVVFPKDLTLLNANDKEVENLFREMKKRKVIWDLTYTVPNPDTKKLYRTYLLAARDAGVTFSTGTDTFNDVSEPFPALFTEIENLVHDGILDPRHVLVAATQNGAEAIGIEGTHGSVEAGKTANLVVLKKNPIDDIRNLREIEFTMKNGMIFMRSDY